MQNFRITIQYDGTNYHGWQIQPNGRTVQGEITRALSLLDHRPVTVFGAGRTDAGVHAEGQVASFFMEKDFEQAELRDAINGNLDRDIRVLEVRSVNEAFNARYSAKEKTYLYRICTDDVVSPFIYRYVHHYRGALDTHRMKGAADALVGTHDFSAFTVADGDAEDAVRTIISLDIDTNASDISIVVRGNGFLRYMVRRIVGTLIDVGRGKLDAATIGQILESRDRSNAGPSAPARGLTLIDVGY